MSNAETNNRVARDYAPAVTLSERELDRISAALRVAAEQYSKDAVTAQLNYTALGGVAIARIAQQFETQAREALELADRIEQRPYEGSDDGEQRCSSPTGHQWNRTAGEADEARLAGDGANDNIRCIHCGADGDA